MSGFTVRLANMVCVLVFLYNRQSSAHAWHPTKAPVTNLPFDPNDPFYQSKSFFSRQCVVTFIGASFSWRLVPTTAFSRFSISQPWETLLVLIYNHLLINQLNYDTVFVSNESQRELFYITVSRIWVQCKFHRMNSVALPLSRFKFTIKLSGLFLGPLDF